MAESLMIIAKLLDTLGHDCVFSEEFLPALFMCSAFFSVMELGEDAIV